MLGRAVWTIAFVLGIACGASEVRFEQSVAAEPKGKLVVELAYGEVEVRTHPASEVRVIAVARGEDASRVEFSLERDGRNVEFTSEIGLGLPLFPSTSDVECQIWIPEDFELDLETSWGEVHATDIGGNVRVDTSRADVELSRIRGDVEVKTTRGPIRIEEVSGHVAARTSRSPIDIRSVSGRVLATTTRSPIRVQFRSDPAGELVTTRSPIEVRVPAGASFDLAVKTSRRGSVRVGPELSVTREGEAGDEHLRINGGGPILRARTSRSDIYVGTEQLEP